MTTNDVTENREADNSIRYPDIAVQLTGSDGNMFMLASKVGRAMKQSGVSREEIDEFYREVTNSESYDAALQVLMRWVDVS